MSIYNHHNHNKNNVVYHALQVEYKEMASWYDRFWRSYTDETLKMPLDEIINQIKLVGYTTCTIVDVGCGTGVLLRHLFDACSQLLVLGTSLTLKGVEPSKEMLEQAQKKFEGEDGTKTDSVITLNNSPAEHLPLNDESADIIVSTSAFHFFRDREQSLQEIKRVLKQDGTLIIADWCGDYFIVKLYHFLEKLRWNWRFKDRYPSPLTSSELTNLVTSAGFCEVANTTYRVRVFSVFFWGVQQIKAKKRDQAVLY